METEEEVENLDSMIWDIPSGKNVTWAAKQMIKKYHEGEAPATIRYNLCYDKDGKFQESVEKGEDYKVDLAKTTGGRCHLFFNCTEDECGIYTKDLPVYVLDQKQEEFGDLEIEEDVAEEDITESIADDVCYFLTPLEQFLQKKYSEDVKSLSCCYETDLDRDLPDDQTVVVKYIVYVKRHKAAGESGC